MICKKLRMNFHVYNKNHKESKMKYWRPKSKLKSSMLRKSRLSLKLKKPNNYWRMKKGKSKNSKSTLMIWKRRKNNNWSMNTSWKHTLMSLRRKL
jgi:hypothetical protein